MSRCLAILLGLTLASPVFAQPPQPTLDPLLRTIDLNVGQSQEVRLSDGKTASVKLLAVEHRRDSIRDAVRSARAQVQVNGQEIWLESANYTLPQTVAGVQIDCPITKGYLTNCNPDAWHLEADARLRLWPAGSPWMNPGTMVYPLKQRWFASSTQMANEPCHVDSSEHAGMMKIYYHYGLDFGGCESLVEVVAATDGLVVSRGTERLPGYEDSPSKPRYDVVYLLDARGWFYRYSHLHEIDDAIRPGVKVRMGQRIGLLGKEGGSGGWSHLHFDLYFRQPSGKWGCQDSYAFVWEAYQNQYHPQLIAVARPHHLIATGEKVTLDASRSWSAAGNIVHYDWTFTDGSRAEGRRVERTYTRPGYYSEILKVTDAAGRTDYDFAIVCVQNPQAVKDFAHTIHATFYPTQGVKPGQELTFKVRSFATTDGEETWDFGDGSPAVKSRSDGNVVHLAKDGYAIVKHAYAKPGDYLVSVQRTNARDETATARLHVVVEQ